MISSIVAAVITVVSCAIVFCSFGLLIVYLYIVDRRMSLQRAAAALQADPQRHSQRHHSHYPEALPGPTDYKLDGPALGNIIIKDEATLLGLRSELVAVHVPSPDSCDIDVDYTEEVGEAAADEELHNDPMHGIVELLDTSVLRPELSERPSRASLQRDFQASLLDGGYVIVECDVSSPRSLVTYDGRCASSTLSTVGPREGGLMEGVEESASVTGASGGMSATLTASKASITQYFRLQQPSFPYGTSKYVEETREAH
jgi:hypothetical protein